MAWPFSHLAALNKNKKRWLLNGAWICSENQPVLCVFKPLPSLASQTRRDEFHCQARQVAKVSNSFLLLVAFHIPAGSTAFVTRPVKEQSYEMFQGFVPILPCPLEGSMCAGNATAMAQPVPCPAWPVSECTTPRVCSWGRLPALCLPCRCCPLALSCVLPQPGPGKPPKPFLFCSVYFRWILLNAFLISALKRGLCSHLKSCKSDQETIDHSWTLLQTQLVYLCSMWDPFPRTYGIFSLPLGYFCTSGFGRSISRLL